MLPIDGQHMSPFADDANNYYGDVGYVHDYFDVSLG